jgi:SRSO17 transposase
MTAQQLNTSRTRLESYLDEMLAPLGRKDRRRWGQVYVRGLLLDGERKSVGAMVPRLPEGEEQALQQFVSQSPWPWEPVWEKLAASARQQRGEAFWIIDDTSFPKKGEHSVGVQRQYCGALGKLANCQVAVSLHQAGPTGSQPLAWRLHLPESWTEDRKRRQQVGIPQDVVFHKKWELALQLIDQARAWGVPDRIVLADADYGDRGEFRTGLEQRGLRYTVGITSQLVVWAQPPRPCVPRRRGPGPAPKRPRYENEAPQSVKALAQQNEARFRRVTWREGTKGAMRSRFWARRVQTAHHWQWGQEPGSAVWLLVEWPAGEPEPTKYFLCDLPGRLSVRRLVRVAKSRHWIEQDYQQMKEELGLDHFEGRSWNGWHHHVTLVMLAYGFLQRERRRRRDKSHLDAAAPPA